MATNNAINQIGVLPSFMATNNAVQSNVTGDGTLYTVVFNTELYDTTNSFDGTSTFTAPLSGTYHFNAGLWLGGTIDAAHTRAIISFITSTGYEYRWDYNLYNESAPGNGVNTTYATEFRLTAADTVVLKVQVIGGNKTISVLQSSPAPYCPYLSGYMISGI